MEDASSPPSCEVSGVQRSPGADDDNNDQNAPDHFPRANSFGAYENDWEETPAKGLSPFDRLPPEVIERYAYPFIWFLVILIYITRCLHSSGTGLAHSPLIY